MKHSRFSTTHARSIAVAIAVALAAALTAATPLSVGAQQQPADLEALKREIDELRRRDEEQRRRIESLTVQVESLMKQKPASTGATTMPTSPPASAAPGSLSPEEALDAALSQPQPATQANPPDPTSGRATSDIWSRGVGSANIRLIDISMDTLFAAGFSTVDSEQELRDLQGGAHDPRNQGFTLQQAELSFTGAVDPYFSGEAHIVASTDGVELEEAFITTSSLPWGLQLELGYFFTEFGRLNPLHPHQWDWMDQNVVITRMFGPEGLRSPGFRLGWLTPLPWSSELHFGMQNADEADLTASFISGEPPGGRPSVGRDVDGLKEMLYLARWANSWEPTPQTTALWGFSGLYGPNDTGNDGQTWIYGTDFTLKWRPRNNFRGWPFVTWQSEIIKRDYTADWYIAGTAGGGSADDGHDHGHDHGGGTEDEEVAFDEDLPSEIMRDVGGYTQVVYGFRPGWATGLRLEYAAGDGPSVIDGTLGSRSDDPNRADRFRASPLLAWWPSHFSRLRLQYNLDWSEQLHDTEHTFWLGVEILYGAHAGHNF
jgi:hypothetical protein